MMLNFTRPEYNYAKDCIARLRNRYLVATAALAQGDDASMRTIMVGVDGSAGGEVAAEYAVEIAQLLRGGVYAVGVLPEAGAAEPELDERDANTVAAERAARGTASSWFEGARKLCVERKVELAETRRPGDPAQVLAQEAESADLVVIGAQGVTADPVMLLGSTVQRLLRFCIKPMLVTRADHRPITRALVGYDGSPDSGHAVELVADLAAAGGWEVVVVTGAPEHSRLADGARRAARLVSARGVEPEVRVVEGDAPTILFDDAKRLDADLIALGGVPRGMLTGFFFGEAWPDVVEQAKVPVLLWR